MTRLPSARSGEAGANVVVSGCRRSPMATSHPASMAAKMRRNWSGAYARSASVNATTRPRAASMPARTAAPFPRFRGWTTTWSAPAASAASAVASAEPSSTTTISAPPSPGPGSGVGTISLPAPVAGGRRPVPAHAPRRRQLAQQHPAVAEPAHGPGGGERHHLGLDEGDGRREPGAGEHRPQYEDVDARGHRGDTDEGDRDLHPTDVGIAAEGHPPVHDVGQRAGAGDGHQVGDDEDPVQHLPEQHQQPDVDERGDQRDEGETPDPARHPSGGGGAGGRGDGGGGVGDGCDSVADAGGEGGGQVESGGEGGRWAPRRAISASPTRPRAVSPYENHSTPVRP